MPSILLIEDDTAVRELLRTCLEGAGYFVQESDTGREGMRKFRKAPCDLVITDIFMPDCDGLDVIRRLRGHHPTVKILAISGGSGTMDYLKEARLLGAARAIHKPFEIQTLLQEVAGLLADEESHPCKSTAS